MSTITAAEIGRQHLGRPVAVDVPTTERIEHAEGTLRWLAHHEDNLVALGIEDPRTGATLEWQMDTAVTVYFVPAGGASNG